MTIPGIGPITALAIQAFAPPKESFRSGRGFSAWLGLVPRQNTTGGKPRLGRVSKMGQRDLRRLLGACLPLRWGREDGKTALSGPYDRPGVSLRPARIPSESPESGTK